MVKIVHDDRSLSMRESLAVRVLLTVIDDYCPEVYMPEHRLQRIRNMTAAENICQLELFYEIAGVRRIDIIDLYGRITAAAHVESAFLFLVERKIVNMRFFLRFKSLPAELLCLRFEQTAAYGAYSAAVFFHKHYRTFFTRRRALCVYYLRDDEILSLFDKISCVI